MSTISRASKPPPRQAAAARPAQVTGITLDEYGIAVPVAALGLDGFRAWARSDGFPERGRFAFLEGVLSIDMSSEEIETHNSLKVEIGRVLPGLIRRSHLGQYYADGVLLTQPEVSLSTEPDAVFATWETLDSSRLRRIPREGTEGHFIELEGSPSWVLEIVSNSSVAKDTRVLRDLYYRAGIPEYWLIDARGADIQFQILIRGEAEYVAVEGQRGWFASQVFERRFRLTREQVRPHYWEYTLAMRPLR